MSVFAVHNIIYDAAHCVNVAALKCSHTGTSTCVKNGAVQYTCDTVKNGTAQVPSVLYSTEYIVRYCYNYIMDCSDTAGVIIIKRAKTQATTKKGFPKS